MAIMLNRRALPADKAPVVPRPLAAAAPAAGMRPRFSTALESVAAHGSVSYGVLTSTRLREIMLGDEPSEADSARIYQALTETPAYRLCEMAREIGLSYDQLQERYWRLTGVSGLGPTS